MDWILLLPMEVRVVTLFFFGAILGSWLNLAIYRLAWTPRLISPWSNAPAGVPARTPADRLPILGWWRLRRESAVHGPGFWIRPMLIEIGMGLSLAALYAWEVSQGGLLIVPLPGDPPAGAFVRNDWLSIVHWQFSAHVLLFALMLVASFIDIDEKIIPDTITLPGTLAGLLLAAVSPWSLLPGNSWLAGGAGVAEREFLTSTAPEAWPEVLHGTPQSMSLLIALGCWWSWCFAIMPRRWMTRRGLSMAMRVLLARLQREPATWWILGLGVVGSAAIAAAWKFAAPPNWAGLLTALIGMAASGGLVWLVRVIGTWALKREAMGFGDVTLMAMVGTFIGWQAALVTFFLAPFAGLLIGAVQWMLHRDNEIPYGPFLCLATAFVVVAWSGVWESAEPYLAQGWLVPAVVALCMFLLGVLLGLLQMLRGLLERAR